MAEVALHFPGGTIIINEGRILDRIEELSSEDDTLEIYISGSRCRMTWLDARGWSQNSVGNRPSLKESIAQALDQYDRKHA